MVVAGTLDTYLEISGGQVSIVIKRFSETN